MTLCSCPNKHSSWWRRTEDVFSVTFFCLPRRLEDIIAIHLANTSWRRLEDILKKSWKTSWRRLEDILRRRIANTSWRLLQDVFKRSWKTKSATLRTSWRRLEDVLENKKCLLGCFFWKWTKSLSILVISLYPCFDIFCCYLKN